MASFAHGADREDPGRAYILRPTDMHQESDVGVRGEVMRANYDDPMRVSSMISNDAPDLPKEPYARRELPPRLGSEMEHTPLPPHTQPLRPPQQWDYSAGEPRTWRPNLPPPEPGVLSRGREMRSPPPPPPPHLPRYDPEHRTHPPSPSRAPQHQASEYESAYRAYGEERRRLSPSREEYEYPPRPHGAIYEPMHGTYARGRTPEEEALHSMKPTHPYPVQELREAPGEAQHGPVPHHHHIVPHHHHHHVVPHHHHVVPHHHHHYHHHHHHHANPVVPEKPSPPRGVPWQEQTSAPLSDVRHSPLPEPHSGAEAGPVLTPLESKLRELASGPRVDSEPVWEYLDRCEQMEEYERKQQKELHAEEERERHDAAGPPASSLTKSANVAHAPVPDSRILLGFGLGMDRGRAVRHLGSFLYDTSGKTCLPAELLVSNIGATVEVRICGRAIGLGITEDEWHAEEAQHQAAVLSRIEQKANNGIPPSLESLALDAQDTATDPAPSLPGRWRLGWRGHEHARMNREIRIANLWNDYHLRQETNKRMKRTHTEPLASALAQPRHAPPVATGSVDVEQSAWRFWSQPSLARRKLWGTDVYTDDSDVLAMCVHAGWIEAPHLPNVPEWLAGGGASNVSKAWTELTERQERAFGHAPRAPPSREHRGTQLTCDLSVTLRIAPKLILYKGCHRGGIKSRSWGNTHDGASLVVESVELRPVRFLLT